MSSNLEFISDVVNLVAYFYKHLILCTQFNLDEFKVVLGHASDLEFFKLVFEGNNWSWLK